MLDAAALALVFAAGAFLAILGGTALVAPTVAGRFLLGFARSPARHFAEVAARFLAGGAFLRASPTLCFPEAFRLFGWVLVATTAGLLLIPWRLHRRFARIVVPRALRALPFVGVSSMILGVLVLWALFCGHVPD